MSFCFFSFAKSVPVNISDDKRAGRLRFESEMPVDRHAMTKTWAFQDTSAWSPSTDGGERITLQKSAAAVADVIEV